MFAADSRPRPQAFRATPRAGLVRPSPFAYQDASPPAMRPVLTLFLLVGSLAAQQSPSAAQVAGLEQDVAQLRTDMARISEQLNELQVAVQRLRAAPPAAKPQGGVADRDAILAEVDKRNAALRADLDKALATFTKQVNDALASRGGPVAVAPVPGSPTPAPNAQTPPAAPSDGLPPDMPRTGIRYKVKAGESLSGIARRNGSKVEWILKANQMDNPNQLRAESEIFIPQP